MHSPGRDTPHRTRACTTLSRVARRPLVPLQHWQGQQRVLRPPPPACTNPPENEKKNEHQRDAQYNSERICDAVFRRANHHREAQHTERHSTLRGTAHVTTTYHRSRGNEVCHLDPSIGQRKCRTRNCSGEHRAIILQPQQNHISESK